MGGMLMTASFGALCNRFGRSIVRRTPSRAARRTVNSPRPAMPRTHQVAVQLDSTAHETLKRLAKTQGKPYAVVITQALAALEITSGSSIFD